MADDWLTDKEKLALDNFKKNYKKGGVETYPLSPSIAAKLYALYLNCNSLTEVAELNSELGLGTIVNSAVEDKWNLRRQEYLENLYRSASDRMLQTAAEGASFVATALAVAHKKHGEKMKKYLQTEDPEWLKGSAFEISSMRAYKEAVDILMKLTGQDRIKKLEVEGSVTHTDKAQEPSESLQPSPSPLSLATSISQLAALKRGSKDAS